MQLLGNWPLCVLLGTKKEERLGKMTLPYLFFSIEHRWHKVSPQHI